jgi:2-polyprenyl-3-methyl-5-hydroxy-6-metoxy-1,4-benzoquinol methylase
LSTGKTKCEQQQRDLDVKISFLSEASAKVATKRMEKLTHYYPDFIRAQSLVHMAVASELFQKRRIVMRQLCKILPLRRTTVSL